MEYRLCNEKDRDSVIKLWKYCFDDSDGYVEFYFRNKFRPENTLVAVDGGNITASIHLNSHSIYLNGKKFDTSYVVGVSTLPEARGVGVMNGLMEEALREMKKRGQKVSILMPIDFRLYRKYGFENCYDILEQTVDVFALRKFRINGVFKAASEEDYRDLKEIYDENTSSYNGSAYRDERYFRDLTGDMESDGGYVYINYENGKPMAYIAYVIADGEMTVREIYYRDFRSYSSVLKFIFNHNTQVKKVRMYTATDDCLGMVLDNPKDAEFRLKPFMMGRILDFRGAIKELDIDVEKGVLENSVKIEIKDDQIDENNGIFSIFSEGGKLRAEKTDGKADMSFTINEIAQILFSYKSVKEIAFVNSAEIPENSDIGKVMPTKKVNYINEYV